MREKIVYFLGAGFSAPLGLPVMSNFLLRSKDLYFSDPDKYQGFKEVFAMIDLMGKAKNYYAVDLFNIEEILSLLEMEDYVGTSTHKEAYLNYLRRVILDLTPAFTPGEGTPQFAQPTTTDAYAAFVATLFGIRWQISEHPVRSQGVERLETVPAYGVISLNYDLVLENSLNIIQHRIRGEGRKLQFAKSISDMGEGRVPFAKLHGSVEPLNIVPPTWNKVASEQVRESWRLAYQLLAEANQIRFLGYSLPPTDTYVRYLLEAAVLKSEHLKRIDVLCLDGLDHSVENRFRSIVAFYRFRFRSGDIREYLSTNRNKVHHSIERLENRLQSLAFRKLEGVHEEFMEVPYA